MEITGYTPEQYTRPEVERRTPERIKKELEAAENVYNKFLELEGEIQPNLSETDLEVLNEIADNVWENEDLSKEEKKEEIEKRIEANKENPELGGIIGLFTIGFDLQKNYEKLKKEYVPYAKDELVEEAKKLTRKIDYEKVVREVDESLKNDRDNFYVVFDGLSQVWELSREEKYGSEGNNYDWVEDRKRVVEECGKEWEEKGWLKKEEENESETGEGEEEIRKRIGRILVDGKEYERLKWKYNAEMDVFREEKFLKYLETSVTDDDLAPGLREAIENYVKRIETNRQVEGKMKMSPENKKEFCRRMIEKGQKDFFDMKYLGFKKKENLQILQQYLYNNLPMGFFCGVNTINREKDIPEKISEDSCTVGHFEVVERDENDNFKSGEVKLYVPENYDELFKIVDHEIGHGVLFFLSLEEYQKWEETVENDPVAITWYVDKSKKVNEETGKREDFCETLMTFASDPMGLKKMSEKRFNYMKDLFESRTEDRFKGNFNHNLDLAYTLEKL